MIHSLFRIRLVLRREAHISDRRLPYMIRLVRQMRAVKAATAGLANLSVFGSAGLYESGKRLFGLPL